jgi:hypothetical protein
MFPSRRTRRARSICAKTVSPRTRTAILEDFRAFETRGLTRARMAEIKALLAAK